MRRLPRTNSATGTSVNSAPLRRIERPVPKNRFFTSCCVMVDAPREAAAFHIVFGSNLHLVPIESMVLIEARVFRGDHSVLEIGRDLAERNEFVTFVVRLAVNPGLQAALDVHRGGRWVDPPGGHKGQHGKRPKKRHTEAEPQNKGSEKTLPNRSPERSVWLFSHISE